MPMCSVPLRLLARNPVKRVWLHNDWVPAFAGMTSTAYALHEVAG